MAIVAVACAVLWGAPAWGHVEKRTDPCGCHHQWGLRHCHPKKKTQRCEAPVKSSEGEAAGPRRSKKAAPTPAPPTTSPPAPEAGTRAVNL